MQFTITAQNGDSVRVSAQNWMLAMGKALPFFSLNLEDAGRVICSPGSDGGVFVEAPGVDRTWMIREIAPALKIVATSPVAMAEEVASMVPEAPSVSKGDAPAVPPPSLMMPVTSTLQKDDPDEEDDEEETLGERLFDLSMDIAGAQPDDACQLSLELLLDFVPAEAASVARGSLNDPHLTFVAATGPVAEDIIGRNVPFGEGLVGLAFDMAGTLVVADVTADGRHMVSLDQDTGFSTMSSLCVPILDSEGSAFGVIQLLNPQGHEFSSEHIEAAETVARTLGMALAAHFG